ncbi:MAG: metallophosphoesterase [Planctomycetia bacterium]|nr:metallophosphoesterase [Planctomycetia bacterium]
MARVLVVPDVHCPGMRRGFVDFLQRIADKWETDRVVHIGDLVDLAALSFHEKHVALRNAVEEMRAARRQIASLVAAFPKADWLIGNHDALTERQARTVGIPECMLRDHAEIWQVPWSVHPRFSKLLIDGVIYAHGDAGRSGADAAFQQAKDNFRSTVIGHFHGQAGVKWWANLEFRVFGMSVGCGIDASRLQFEYGRRITAKPILGCGVVLNGRRAFFEPWLLKSR